MLTLSWLPKIPIYGKLSEDCESTFTIYFIMRAYKVKQFPKINTVNDLIFSLRAFLNWNQSKFARVLGVSRETISNWETGNKMSRELEIGIKIGIAATKMGLPVEDIIAFGLPDPGDRPSLRLAEKAGEYRTDDQTTA